MTRPRPLLYPGRRGESSELTEVPCSFATAPCEEVTVTTTLPVYDTLALAAGVKAHLVTDEGLVDCTIGQPVWVEVVEWFDDAETEVLVRCGGVDLVVAERDVR